MHQFPTLIIELNLLNSIHVPPCNLHLAPTVGLQFFSQCLVLHSLCVQFMCFYKFPCPDADTNNAQWLSPPCAEDPPPPPVRVTPRYVVLDNSADLVLEARFRGNFYSNDWVYNEDDPTFLTGGYSLFSSANRTNVGQTYTIPAGSASHRVGYYGPQLLPTFTTSIRPTPENTVFVGSFGN